MRYTRAQQLRSEIGTVERFLAETPEDALIMRLSWEDRLHELQAQLAQIEAAPEAHPLSLTFRGDPVDGTRSIDAAFAVKALKAFVEATDTVTASLVSELRDHGRLPGVGDRTLRIIDTATGSFGFELELPPPLVEEQAGPALADGEDLHVEAIHTTLRLLGEAATGDEDRLSDLIAATHPRAASKVSAFAKVLAENNALFAVAFDGEQVRFDRDEQVRRTIEALADADISEEEAQHRGTLLGVLPHARSFEVELEHDGAPISGRVDRSITDIMALNKQWVGQLALLTFRVVRVRNRSRYILTEVREV